jgi:hypothetical protein
MADIKDILNNKKAVKAKEKVALLKLRPWSIDPSNDIRSEIKDEPKLLDLPSDEQTSVIDSKIVKPAIGTVELLKDLATDANNTSNNFENRISVVTESLRNDSVTTTESLRNRRNDISSNSVTIPQNISNNTATESVTSSVIITKQLRNDSVTSGRPSHINRLSGHKLTIVLA